MFLVLLAATLVTAIIVSTIVIVLFRKPTLSIFMRIIGEDIAAAWHKFLIFALFVVGVSSGVQIWKLERFIMVHGPDEKIPVLDADRWTFEIYRTIISTLGGLAWALLVFFIVALIAYAIVKRRQPKVGEASNRVEGQAAKN